MNELEKLYEIIKNANTDGNLIIPKDYLRKFIMMNLLMNMDNFDNLDEEKQKKYIQILESLVRLYNL